MKFKNSFGYCLLLALFVGCGPKQKSLDDIANEAFALSRQYRATNKLTEAESVMQDALMKTKSPALMGGFVELLEQTQQWKKLEDYIEVNGSDMYPHDLVHAQRVVASQHFTAKNWERAARFSLKAADTDLMQRGTPEGKRWCPSLAAPENIRNAAAAFYNSRNQVGMLEARNSLLALSAESRCAKPEDQIDIRKQIDAIEKMMRDFSFLR